MHPSNDEALLNLCGDANGRTVCIIATGWDTYPAERKATELDHILSKFNELGFVPSQFDLTTATKDSIRTALTGKTLVWVMAGNTFYLNFHLHKSGFAEIIKELVTGGLVYGGESAGAVVAGRTIHGAEKVDDPKEAPEVIWQGLGLVDHGILPHADWEKYREPVG
jgi:dipeptidase E